MNNIDVETNAQDVVATLNYSGNFEGRGRFDIVDPSKNHFTLDPRNVLIRDIRAMRDNYSLDINGFEFTKHSSKVAEDPELFEQVNTQKMLPTGVVEEYSQEMILFLSERLGASYVVPQVGSFLARASAGADKKTWAGAAGFVHLDYTPETAALFLKWNADALGEVPFAYKDYCIIQTWRAISPGPQLNTLAICDGTSVSVEDGVVVDAVFGPKDEPGKFFPFRLCKFREDNQWYYLSNMQADDLLLFKGFDSREPDAMNAMHSAFDNSLVAESGFPRKSIEARFIAFFN